MWKIELLPHLLGSHRGGLYNTCTNWKKKRMNMWYRLGEDNMEVLRNVCTPLFSPPKEDSYLILFPNAHSVCVNLHLLLALNIAWNVCAAWQKIWYEEKSTGSFVLLNNGAEPSQFLAFPCSLVSHGAAGKEACDYFLNSPAWVSPHARTDRRFRCISLPYSVCWNHWFVSALFVCLLLKPSLDWA